MNIEDKIAQLREQHQKLAHERISQKHRLPPLPVENGFSVWFCSNMNEYRDGGINEVRQKLTCPEASQFIENPDNQALVKSAILGLATFWTYNLSKNFETLAKSKLDELAKKATESDAGKGELVNAIRRVATDIYEKAKGYAPLPSEYVRLTATPREEWRG